MNSDFKGLSELQFSNEINAKFSCTSYDGVWRKQKYNSTHL